MVFLLLTPAVIYLSEKKAESQSYGPPQTNVKAESATYVGIEKCKMCHSKRYDEFMKRKFAKAWKILEMREETDNPECLQCHTTGYGKPGGFADVNSTPHLKFKQCEACHGPGSLHVNDPGNAQHQEEMLDYVKDTDPCIKCHICVFTHGGGLKF